MSEITKVHLNTDPESLGDVDAGPYHRIVEALIYEAYPDCEVSARVGTGHAVTVTLDDFEDPEPFEDEIAEICRKAYQLSCDFGEWAMCRECNHDDRPDDFCEECFAIFREARRVTEECRKTTRQTEKFWRRGLN